MHPKDIVAVIMSVILMVLAPAYAFAIDTESGLHFDIPNGWDQTDLGKKEKYLIYHGECASLGLELGVYSHRTIQTNLENNWINYSEDELKAQAEMAINNQKEGGDTNITDYSIMNTEQMRFIVFDGVVKNKESEEKNFTQYLTIVNGGSLHFSFYSDEPLTEFQLSESELILRSTTADALTEQRIDTSLVFKLVGLGIVLLLMIASVIWNVCRYRKKHFLSRTH